MYIVFIRTALLYFLVIFVVRLMGKRQIGELQPYELVITIMISDLASLPMQYSRLPLILGIIPIVTLLIINIIITEIQQHSVTFRKLIDGTPCVLVSNGKLNLSMIKKQRLTVDDILEEIRSGGYLDIEEIQYAILENNGKVSIIPKSSCDTVTKHDLNINVKDPKMPILLYVDGKINKRALHILKKDVSWLDKKLKEIKAPKKEDLFLIMIDSNEEIFYQELYSDDISDELSL